MKLRIVHLWFLLFCLVLPPSVGRADELIADDAATPGHAIALIFIHGWTNDRSRWNTPLQWLRSSSGKGALRDYKVYRYEYDWSQKIEQSGLGLAREIERTLEPRTRFVVVAHSMGGLVARAAIENYTGRTASLESRLVKLITIATPHHGSPSANIAWLQNDSKIERLDIGQWGLSIFTKLNNDGGYGLGWDNSDGQMPQAVWNGQRGIGAIPNSIPRASRFTQQLNARSNLDATAKRRLTQKYIAIGAYQSYVPDLSPTSIGFLVKENRDKADLAGRVVLARHLQNSDDPNRKWNERIKARWVDTYIANDDVVPLQSALFLDDGVRVGNLNGEQVGVSEADVAAWHSRIGRIKIVRDTGHSKLPDDPEVLSFLAATLRENTEAEPGNQLTSRWKGEWRGEDGHRFSFELLLNFHDGKQGNGHFIWTLTHAPMGSSVASRVGQSGIEHVRGSYDATIRELKLQGFRLEHDNLLSLDAYRVTVAVGGRSFSGFSRSHSGRWRSPISARAVSADARDAIQRSLQQMFAGQWHGDWAGDDGARYGFTLQLSYQDGRCEGVIY